LHIPFAFSLLWHLCGNVEGTLGAELRFQTNWSDILGRKEAQWLWINVLENLHMPKIDIKSRIQQTNN
jgi:hypothetical protein